MNQPQFTIHTEQSREDFARFIIEPLPQGFGDTLGNSLRRVLYSSIPGAAITSVTISGVNHQFATIEGVREDAVQIILAIKQIRISLTGDKPVKIFLSAKGSGEVTASQFEVPVSVKIANPKQVLAHLSDKSSKLDIEATVEPGLGYSPADERKSSILGVIPVDATFTPVLRVNYTIEDTRVGRVTNFDKLILDVTTNGTIAPLSAVQSAAQTLVDYYSAVVNPRSSDSPSGTSSSASGSGVGSSISIEELDLPTRIANALQKANLENVGDLLAMPQAEMAKVKNLGSKSVKIIEAALKERGFDLVQ